MRASDSSTQRLSDHIDQLDLALDQLAVADRNFDRFALMLVDNVVELTLHSFAQGRAHHNQMWSTFAKPKYDPEAVKQALGRRFDAKAKFAAKAGLITAEVCDSLLLLHNFRNTAYHQGQRHEGILHSLAIFYFRNACELLVGYQPNYWSSSSRDEISYRARKYLGATKWGGSQEAMANAFKRLGEVAASMDENLAGDLAADMAETIKRTDSEIQFVVDNIGAISNSVLTRDQVVLESQAWPLAWTDEGVEIAVAGGCPSNLKGDVYHWLLEHHTWQIGGDPIPSWKGRLAALEAEKDHHKALKRYCDFFSQTSEFRAQVGEHAGGLENEIESRADAARGK